jgi:ActR/RegA family two-component response regulator
MDQHVTEQPRILVVTRDRTTVETLISTLETAGGYQVSTASNFQEALDMILTHKYAMALVDVKLPDLSGIDLLTAAGVLRSAIPTILIDDTLSLKSAVAALRIGAVDYLSKPLNLDFILMRIDRELQQLRHAATDKPEPGNGSSPQPPSTALRISQEQFRQIDHELQALYIGIKAQFIGLVDAAHNLVGAAGKLANCDLLLLTKALGSGGESSRPLLDILGDSPFYSTYFEGSDNGVYIINFGKPDPVSLIVICSVKAKRGVVGLYSKRAADAIDHILRTASVPDTAWLSSG